MPRADKADRKNYNREYYAKRKALLEKAKEIENIQSGETQENIVMNIAEIYAPQQEETIEENPVFITRHDEVAKLKDEISALNNTINELKNKLKDNDELVIEQEELIQDQEYEITEIKIKLKYKDDVIIEKDKQIEYLKADKDTQIENFKSLLNMAMTTKPVCDTTQPTKYVPKLNKEHYLNVVCKDAVNFGNYIYETFEDMDFNDYNFKNFLNMSFESATVINLNIAFNRLEKHRQPIQVTDIQRGSFYYRDNDKWIHSKDDIKTFDNLLDSMLRKQERLCSNHMLKLAKQKYRDEDEYEAYAEISGIKIGGYYLKEKIPNIIKTIKNSWLKMFVIDKQYL